MIQLDKKYTISEVAEFTHYPPHVLRYYEKEFNLDIPRNESNHRTYTYKEIEIFQYIKSLQDKGFSNKQIKLIIDSPEILLDAEDETALTLFQSKEDLNAVDLAKEISTNLQEEFVQGLEKIISQKYEDNVQIIEELKYEIIALREELASKERDVLICENAKLKMKFKAKSYEVAELKEKLKRLEHNNGFFNKLFKR